MKSDGGARGLDNRKLWQLARVCLKRGSKPLHLRMSVNGKSIVYCYIRKNASSAFKQLCVDVSAKHPKPDLETENPIRFLEKYHQAQFPRDYLRADHVIWVYRDPVARIVSLFKNKFVARTGYRGIYGSFLRVTGLPPEEATFDDFVYRYLTNTSDKLDAHVISQYRHLLPIRYTNSIPVDDLCSCMTDIIGEELAHFYFGEKKNITTDYVPHEVSTNAMHDVPSSELHRRFLDGKGMLKSCEFLKKKFSFARNNLCQGLRFNQKNLLLKCVSLAREMESHTYQNGSEPVKGVSKGSDTSLLISRIRR